MAVAPAEDALSPTTIILNRIRAQGKPINPDNIRRAVAEMGRSSNQAGPDVSGELRIGETEDSSPAPQRRSNRPAPGRARPATPQAKGGTPDVPPDRREGAGSPTTSAPPTDPNAGNELDLSSLIAPMLGGAGLYGASRFMRGGSPALPGQQFMGNQPMPPTGRMMDLNPTAIAGDPRAAIAGPPQATIAGPQVALPAPDGGPPPATDMESAMQRALAPPGAPPELGGSVDLSGVRPLVNPADVTGPRPLPPGISDADAARAGMGRGGMPPGAITAPPDVVAPTPDVMPVRPPGVAMPGVGGGAPTLPEMTAGRPALLQALIDAAQQAIRGGVRK
jgi:hypothetical protein